MAYSSIVKPTDYFNTVLYSGTGSSQAITGVGFQPDWTWIKVRSTTGGHRLVDAVRGATKFLVSNATNAEGTDATQVASLDSDGFTVGSDSATNLNSGTFASWNWLGANGTASNSDGSITSTVSANTTAGFSIVSYTGNATSGATIGHGLGVEPFMIIIKNRSSAKDWAVYHKNVGNNKKLLLNTTDAESSSSYFNSTSPTSTVFSVNNSDTTNDTNPQIAYCFAEKTGYSKFGSYTGNGNADGTFIYTGFKPAFVMFKNTTTSSTNWHIVDTKRNTFNIVDKLLFPNDTGAEGTQSALDLTSNGFKVRVTNGFINTSGDTYIYMAFAESPFVTAGTKAAGTAR